MSVRSGGRQTDEQNCGIRELGQGVLFGGAYQFDAAEPTLDRVEEKPVGSSADLRVNANVHTHVILEHGLFTLGKCPAHMTSLASAPCCDRTAAVVSHLRSNRQRLTAHGGMWAVCGEHPPLVVIDSCSLARIHLLDAACLPGRVQTRSRPGR